MAAAGTPPAPPAPAQAKPPPRPTALVDFRAPDADCAPLRLAFGEPRERLRALRVDQVRPLLARAEALARAGAWCVGYLHYEAAPAFDAAFATHAPADPARPLAAFAVYDAPLDAACGAPAWVADAPFAARWSPGPGRAAFDATIDAILEAIAAGEVYQVNVTAPLPGTLDGDALALFAALRRAQPNAYAAYLDLGTDARPDDRFLSVSPELFFDWRDGRVLARPMKGTAARGATAAADAAQAAQLRDSPKERAENLMIVDLLRNDLSRVAEPFSVRVPRLFHTEAWPTVWQMSSDVVARTRAGTTLADLFGALFPCGSVTGAPKVRAMRLIRALEGAPRGVYCGAIGVLQPGGAATFNVPIRTLVLRDPGLDAADVTDVAEVSDRAGMAGRADVVDAADAAGTRGAPAALQLRCGIGSGITADASAAGEWDEWRHKRAFVERASQPFELLETLRLEDGAFADADAHLARMAGAAAHFGFAAPLPAARRALAALAAAHPQGAWRVRLLADRAGAARAEAFALEPAPASVRVRLASAPLVGSDGEFVRFKTTRRAHYDAFAPTDAGVFDTLLWNERGELTEFTRGNVALCIDGRWLTPALHSGLLPGVARARLLDAGRLQEAVLTRDDLARAAGLAFFNSLRGWIAANLD